MNDDGRGIFRGLRNALLIELIIATLIYILILIFGGGK